MITADNLKYAIVSKDEATTSIVVAYWVEGFTVMAQQNMTLRIKEGSAEIPKGQELIDLIMLHAPIEYLNKELTQYKLAPLVDWTEIDRLISVGKGQMPVFDR